MILKQSTAASVTVGPILDSTGVAKTDEVVASVLVSKNGGAPAALNGSATLTHRHTGNYTLLLTTSDTDTVGTLEFTLSSTTNAMPIKACNVVEEAVYVAHYAASGTGVPALGALEASVQTLTTTVGAAGAGLTALAQASIWDATLATNIGTTNTTVATNLDAAITTRMATYTQPTGFLAATFPTTVASTTNITAGTMTTVTNLTNAPTSGDLTATMKASVNTEVDNAIETYRLDELLAADSDIDGAAPPTVGSVFHELMTKTAGSFTYDQTTDSLEAVRDHVGDGTNLTEAGGTGDHLNAIPSIANIPVDGSLTATLADGVTHGGTTATLELGANGITAPLTISQAGLGHTAHIKHTGTTGSAMVLELTNASSAAESLRVKTAGTGSAALIQTTNAAGTALYALASGGSGTGIRVSATGGSAAILQGTSLQITSGELHVRDSDGNTFDSGLFALESTLGTAADTDIATDIANVKTVADAIPTLAEILAGGDIDGYTLEETLKLCLAALAGKLSGAATTTVTIRAADDSKDRIVATVDSDGNRTAVTLTETG